MKTFASQLSHLIATDYVPWPFRDDFQQAILYVRHSVKSLMFALDTSHGILWNLMEPHGRISASEPGCAVDRAPAAAAACSRRSHVAFRSPPSRVAQWVAQWAPPGSG